MVEARVVNENVKALRYGETRLRAKSRPPEVRARLKMPSLLRALLARSTGSAAKAYPAHNRPTAYRCSHALYELRMAPKLPFCTVSSLPGPSTGRAHNVKAARAGRRYHERTGSTGIVAEICRARARRRSRHALLNNGIRSRLQTCNALPNGEQCPMERRIIVLLLVQPGRYSRVWQEAVCPCHACLFMPRHMPTTTHRQHTTTQPHVQLKQVSEGGNAQEPHCCCCLPQVKKNAAMKKEEVPVKAP